MAILDKTVLTAILEVLVLKANLYVKLHSVLITFPTVTAYPSDLNSDKTTSISTQHSYID